MSPFSDRFEELQGKGPALGIDEQTVFEENQICGLTPGQIIVLATDGIWEARNKEGSMFGKEPLYDIIRQGANTDAEDILNECFKALEKFQSGAVREDDVTIVVLKIVGFNSQNASPGTETHCAHETCGG